MDDRPRIRNPSPYATFTRQDWAKLRADTPLTLDAADLDRLSSLNDPIDVNEVEQIYLPISRLLAFYVTARQQLFRATQRFLGHGETRVPYVIAVAGSVAVGKSTTARVLRALLARWPATPKVDLVTTDGFLLPNAVLQREGLMNRKGFPESYDVQALIRFISDIKAGKREVTAPVYSHLVYDVVRGEQLVIDRPDIVIIEGLNVLQTGDKPQNGRVTPFVSDFIDFGIFLDADEPLLHRWYVERFMRLRETAFRDPQSYFRKYAQVSKTEAMEQAEKLWADINLPNLRENIRPTRPRADLILKKGRSHRIDEVRLRKI
ncbi:type I pantothenate kinase [Methylopila capsulata]|uniref:Pantothenate kinase n=1 Tax=Methylopila capsulata TaxID=61654 RepID=A0A9W6IT85_9HYPH|nr:type I pantothenate kinase [Methylopila capsulata]MBM7851811.1 type I pantothenate kinase [Methylopila capsulata]GLK54875.1 pantothenate kinase [Methylopila capsulata]